MKIGILVLMLMSMDIFAGATQVNLNQLTVVIDQRVEKYLQSSEIKDVEFIKHGELVNAVENDVVNFSSSTQSDFCDNISDLLHVYTAKVAGSVKFEQNEITLEILITALVKHYKVLPINPDDLIDKNAIKTLPQEK